MGKRKKDNRRKSSSSDTEGKIYKQSKYEDHLNISVSDALSEANSVLFDLQPHNDMASGIEKSSNQTSTMTSSANQGNDLTSFMSEMRGEMKLVLSTVNEIKSSQDGMRKSFDSKLDRMRNEFMTTIDSKMRALRDEIGMDISRESNRIDQLTARLQTMQTRLDSVEQAHGPNMNTDSEGQGGGFHGYPGGDSNDPDLCIIASGIPYQEGENLLEKVNGIISALGIDVSSAVDITGATRFKSRIPGRVGHVKISFRNVRQKILVLRNKMALKDSDHHKDIYLKSSKSHAERLIELNARTLLRQLPQGNNFRVDANGRIRARQGQTAPLQNERSQHE
jgi:hypothetical protein